jgi:hypothetical protein
MLLTFVALCLQCVLSATLDNVVDNRHGSMRCGLLGTLGQACDSD